MPVSYTHLDVYKRQGHARLCQDFIGCFLNAVHLPIQTGDGPLQSPVTAEILIDRLQHGIPHLQLDSLVGLLV